MGFVPQLGITTQVGDGNGGIGTTFTGGVQLDGNSDSGIGGFVAGGVNDGNSVGSAQELRQGSGSASRTDKHRQQHSLMQTCKPQSWLELTSTGLEMLEEFSQQCWVKLLLN